ncbi:hypothetical protein [Enterococcus sp. 5H]|uniref:hypothetical protein n=1 Tax=Enterococcus sp. 5H TaxID=1229490 RepID=UPI002303CBB7|nr:hypothetical protein [Enterococcus sp. 5H]MDA9472784.1 hypothetical protein [Enterococcus sp. 5H]
MIHLVNFYHEKSKKFFFSSLLLIVASYFARYVFQLTIPESRWDRVPIVLSVVVVTILIWRMNRLDIQSNHQTLANTAVQSTFEKIMAKYLLSYLQVIVIIAINLVFNFATISLGIVELLLLSVEVALYLVGMISYLILFRGVIDKLSLANVSKTVVIISGWIMIFLLNGMTRHYFPQRLAIVLPINNGNVYPSALLLNACLSAAILFTYLWLEKNQSENNW